MDKNIVQNKKANITINKERLINNLSNLSKIGINCNGGIDRSFGSQADFEGRKYLINLWKEQLKLNTSIDACANLWVKLPGSENLPAIILGSHIDTVPSGGAYDGALGVLVGAEIVQTIKENNIKLKHPIGFVAFSSEEPNPFISSTIGSRAASGNIKKEELINVVSDENGDRLADILEKFGGSINDIEKAQVTSKDIGAFIECHIEQGRKLYDQKISLGIVTNITGIYRESITIIGEANHAGTTMMKHRHDALLAASEFCLAFEKNIKDTNNDEVVGTIGHIEVFPNATNVVPGKTELILEIRTQNNNITNDIVQNLSKSIKVIEEKRGVKILRQCIESDDPVPMDEYIQSTLIRSIEASNENYIKLPSMAGHDATQIAGITKTGMIFIPSIDGKSHCPEEKVNFDDVEKVGNVLLKTILTLDQEMDKV
ncbi:allantoate amidohydrolase [Clostridium sp. DL1XJH146]